MAPDSYRFRYADRWDHHFADLGRTNLAWPRKVRIRARIVRQLLQVRNRLHDACQETGENRTRNHEFERVSTEDLAVARPWLLLRRSAQPEFYDDGGSAEISGYGQRRRSIKNLQSLAEAITAAGFKVAIYEPGLHSLGHQVQTFGMAKGIIGIRGAEFANLSWMRSDSRAVMIATPAKVGVTSRNLARALGIGFHSIPVAETYPDVNPEDVLAILRRIDHPS